MEKRAVNQKERRAEIGEIFVKSTEWEHVIVAVI